MFLWSVSIGNNGGLSATFAAGDPAQFAYQLFKLAGLTAFFLVSLQIATGPFNHLWKELYGPNFNRYHQYQGLVAFCFAWLHPLLLLFYWLYSKTNPLTFASGFTFHYYFGPAALLLLTVTVATAALTHLLRQTRFRGSWRVIHYLNYLVFLLVFFHSLNVGSDLEVSSPLRPIWWGFFLVWLLGLGYQRGYVSWKRRQVSVVRS